jgi:hypothetical protein
LLSDGTSIAAMSNSSTKLAVLMPAPSAPL